MTGIDLDKLGGGGADDGDMPVWNVDAGLPLGGEWVPGTPPGGAPSGAAGGVLSGTYPNPGFAADMATQAELDGHTGDTSDAHDASAVSFSPTGAVAATDVQAAIAEVDSEKVPKSLYDAQSFLVAVTDDTPAAVTVAASRILGRKASGDLGAMTAAELWALLAAAAGHPEVIIIAAGDETTAITTGTAKVTFRMPFAFTLTAVRASLTTASSSGIPTFDINEAGTTILSTKLTVDASELTSTTAATPAVISDANLADDAEMTIDIDVAGTGAKGPKIYLIGTRA